MIESRCVRCGKRVSIMHAEPEYVCSACDLERVKREYQGLVGIERGVIEGYSSEWHLEQARLANQAQLREPWTYWGQTLREIIRLQQEERKGATVETKKCEKCGSTGRRVEYHVGRRCVRRIAGADGVEFHATYGEHLHVTCSNCGFDWIEKTESATEACGDVCRDMHRFWRLACPGSRSLISECHLPVGHAGLHEFVMNEEDGSVVRFAWLG